MKSLSSKILLGLALLLIVLQFFGSDTSVPEYDGSKDFLTIHQPSQEISTIIQSACYDCHSYQTNYPWYSNIVPVSWWLQDHIDEGRDEFNLSLWADYPADRADHKLEEAIELVDAEEMPLPSYTWIHSDARLSDQERRELSAWFTSLRDELQDQAD
ncbi:MAG TPA: heme-binding domain-containing protein [Gracilimonas sp.]|uniref:heme-binding domain-containing protein n=1 Tax=Gracilimonas sp. TaxID=1974203 RepID=UPI002D95F66F|nr:heme-binding domain-containing protein [Gracilimonas sp.]